jgi:hypothetical protein
MSLEDFKEYYGREYGKHRLLPSVFGERMERVEAKGTSANHVNSLDDLIANNRAGKDGTTLTKEQIIEWYIRHRDECRRGDPCPILGAPPTA